MLKRKKYIVCMTIGLLFSIVMTGLCVREKGLQKQVASQVLRFHVLANSDSPEDQALKMQVKETVLSFMKKELPASESLEQTRTWAKTNLARIENVAGEVVRKQGYSYPVHAEVTEGHFPDKTYGDITFPAGAYEALRIEIGEGRGQNWWCVLYPNLCFIDAVRAVVPEEGKEELKEVLDEDAYERVTTKTIFRIKWFFF